MNEAARDGFALFWEAVTEPEVEAFPYLLSGVRLESLFLCLPCTVVFTVSSGNRYSSLRHTYSGTRWVFLVSGWRWDPGSDWGAPGNNNGTGYYFPNLIGRHNT